MLGLDRLGLFWLFAVRSGGVERYRRLRASMFEGVLGWPAPASSLNWRSERGDGLFGEAGRPLGALLAYGLAEWQLVCAVLHGVELLDHLHVIPESVPGLPGGFGEAVVDPVDLILVLLCV